VTDIVAWRSLKTPTAVADFLVTQTLECENSIIEMASSISSAVNEIIASAGEQLSALLNRTTATSRLIVRIRREQLGFQYESLVKSNKNFLRSAGERTDRLERSLQHLDPARVMSRGFTMTTKNGTMLHSSSDVQTGDIIVTYFEHGRASSIVKETTKKR
jgi:exodeoxyribonuclease VII large subunit